MINQLDKALRRLLTEARADAAVLWVQRTQPAGAAVLTSCPAGVMPAGTEWPVIDGLELETVERDPARLATIVPTTLRLRLPAPPAAAQSFALGHNLFLLLVWHEAVSAYAVSEVLRHVIRNELSYLATLVEDSRFNQTEADRLLATLNALQEAVVTVDPHLGQANVNTAAAGMLEVPAGQIPAAEFAAAMATLAGRALNRDEAAEVAGHLQRDPLAEVDSSWRFPELPTHVRVRSMPLRQGAFAGRIWVLADQSVLSQALGDARQAQERLRASADAMQDPQVLLETVVDRLGVAVDLIYRDLNQATCDYLGTAREDLLNRSALETLPNLEESGLLARYAACAQTGQPLVLNDFAYHNEILDDARRYDIRATRVRPGVINLTWRDVTDRYTAARRIAESEEQFRLLAENSGDVVTRIRDGRFTWVSPSIEQTFGAPPPYWIGRRVMETVPPGDELVHRAFGRSLAAGEPVRTRARAVGADGITHWIHLHVQPFYDREGRMDGATSSFRVIDDEVAAEEARDEARRRQAAADALYHRSMDSAAVGMALSDNDGNFIDINAAMGTFFGYPVEELRGMSWIPLTAPASLEADLAKWAEVKAGRIESYQIVKEFIHRDGHPIWGNLSVGCVRAPDGRPEVFIAQINDITAEVLARRELDRAESARAEADARFRRSMETSPIGTALATTKGEFTEVNEALCEFFGYDADTLRTKTWIDLTAAGSQDDSAHHHADLLAGRIESYRMTKEYIHADGHRIWGDLMVSCLRKNGIPEAVLGQVIDITAEVEGREALQRAQALQARADARYRRLMAGSNIGMTLITPDGRFDVVNQSLCDFFGYDEATLCTKTWQQLTAADYLDADLGKVEDVLAGRIDSYRMAKQYIHADGHLIWGDLAVSCLRDENGRVERFVSQIADITAEMEARRQILQRDEQNRVLARRLQVQADRTKAELDSAAAYVASLLPGDLTGPVRVTSAYLPSRELSGDCYGYSWVDDDHLVVYLIDVSGHGVAPALMSVSVLNMVRSGSVPRRTLLDPAALLAALNTHFQIERQGGNYFTMWFGVYHRPTRTLRYANAGHPPALVFPPHGPTARLSGGSPPVGMLEDVVFDAHEYEVPAGSRILLYSDGAFELPLPGDKHGTLEEFVDLCTTQAAAPDWTLGRLSAELRGRTADGQFEDDCSMILLQFD